MKPLNRPMFRYGGPIKEGVMSGIREPKKDGGLSKQFNTGLVGDERYPKTDGRENHALFIPPMIMAGLGVAGRALARPFGKFVAKRVPQFFAGPNKQYGGTGKKIFEAGYKKKAPKIDFEPNRLGLAFKNDPLAKTVMGGTTMVGRGIKKAGKGIYAAGKYGTTTPSGIALTGATAGPFIYNALKADPAKDTDGDGISEINKKKRQIGMPENLTLGGGQNIPNIDPQLSTKSAEELKKDRIQKYRDIMDIKGMNKDAAYNSLIAASQAINESGDFKGDIKSGKLINQIIQATSKQFDKPKATKDAIDTLILKGEIEKDLKASDPAAKLAAELTSKRIDLADKQLKGDTLQDTVNAIYAKTGAFPSGSGLAGVARTKGIDVKMVIKSEDINNFIEQNPGKDAVDFMESEVVEATKKGTPVEPGAYVVKDRIIVIDSEGNVSPYL